MRVTTRATSCVVFATRYTRDALAVSFASAAWLCVKMVARVSNSGMRKTSLYANVRATILVNSANSVNLPTIFKKLSHLFRK